MKYIITILITTITIFAGNFIEIKSGEYKLNPNNLTRLFIAIPKHDGYISITGAHGAHCQISIRNKQGKILNNLSMASNRLETKVKANQQYIIYAKAKDTYCKSFEIYIP